MWQSNMFLEETEKNSSLEQVKLEWNWQQYIPISHYVAVQ